MRFLGTKDGCSNYVTYTVTFSENLKTHPKGKHVASYKLINHLRVPSDAVLFKLYCGFIIDYFDCVGSSSCITFKVRGVNTCQIIWFY